jgi:hypothetical protein
MVNTRTLGQSLSNAERALRKMQLYLSQDPCNEVSRAAVIYGFECTFEAMWTLLQKWGTYEGVTVHSPKSALSFGLQSGVCLTEQIWLEIMHDRGLTLTLGGKPGPLGPECRAHGR